jgi:hypothetical protein
MKRSLLVPHLQGVFNLGRDVCLLADTVSRLCGASLGGPLFTEEEHAEEKNSVLTPNSG